MRKRENVIVVDVETCGGFGCPLVYDLGYVVKERATGRIIKRASLVIEEVFYGMPQKMATAYYANKLPLYHEGIAKGYFKVVSLWTAWKMVKADVRRYGVKRVYAYNCAFDKNALNNTMRRVTGTRVTFFPRSVKYCDIWHMACQTVLKQKRFRKFAEKNGMVSPAGNLRTSAEAAYAYITNEADFEEAHTGLEDVLIEVEILHHVLRQKKRVSEEIIPSPWRIPQTA